MVPIVIMGVAGCGKSSLGAALAQALGLVLIEGDAYHPASNVEKMRTGVPLTDADRASWLTTLGQVLREHPAGAVLSCSALKQAYRERLREAAPGLLFVHLELSRDEARRRVAQRGGTHYFGPGLVDSQFDTLESPAGEHGVLCLDATRPLPDLTAAVRHWLQELPS